MLKLSKEIECSLLICTYNPVWDKLKSTLQSIVVQKNIIFEIVVTDDGSENDLFENIKEYLDSNMISNYKFVSNDCNQGTVINVLRGMNACKGRYVKPISPGDCLHGLYALREWCDFMDNHDNYIMSYCDAAYYNYQGKDIKVLQRPASPQSREPTVMQYLFYRDLCLGASALFRRENAIHYFEMLRGKVIYAEDFAYRIMIYCGEKIINIPKTLLLYEFGTGISTSGSQYWKKVVIEEEKELNKILLSIKECDEAHKLNIRRFISIPSDNDLKYKIARYIFCPSKIIFRIKIKFFPRLTPNKVDDSFVKRLLVGEKW